MAWMGLSREHEDEIAARGLDVSLAERLSVWSDGRAIAFDYRRADGRVHNTKLRRGKGDMPWATQGLPLIPWNVQCLEGESADRILVWVEGEFDGWAMIQAGILDVVSVPNGAPSSENEKGQKRYAYLYRGERLHPAIDKFSVHVLAVDNDEKGLFLREALAARLGVERCRYVTWPDGCKDANDVLREHGEQALRDLVFGAQRPLVDEVAALSEIEDGPILVPYSLGFFELERVRWEGERGNLNYRGVPTIKRDADGRPTDPLRHHLNFPRKGLVTLLGPYGQGKSTFIRNIIVNMAVQHGWKSAITCFEEDVKPDVRDSFRKCYMGKPVGLMNAGEIEAADAFIEDNIFFIRKVLRRKTDASRLISLIEYAIKVYGINMFVVDPFNEIDHTWDSRGKSKSDYIGDVLMELRDLTTDYNCLGVVCLHPPAEMMRKVSGKYKNENAFYRMSAAADSAMFANKSNICLCAWQPGTEWFFFVNPDKIKKQEVFGKPIGIEFWFCAYEERFYVSRTGWDIFSGEDD